MSRIEIYPDPAWDLAEEEEGGVLAVELSWEPDALAGRPPELAAAPKLVTVLTDAGLTGFRVGPARGYYGEGAFGIEEGQSPPELVRLIVENTPEADFSYEPSQGLTVSERALSLLREHCQSLTEA